MRRQGRAPAGPSVADATPAAIELPRRRQRDPGAQQPAEAAPRHGRDVRTTLGRARGTPGAGRVVSGSAARRSRRPPVAAPPPTTVRGRRSAAAARAGRRRVLAPRRAPERRGRRPRRRRRRRAQLQPGRDERLRDHEALRRPWQRAARSHAAGAAGRGDAALPQLGRGSLPSQERPLRNAARAGRRRPAGARRAFRRQRLQAHALRLPRDAWSPTAIAPRRSRRLPSGGPFIVDDTGKVQLPD